SEVRRHRGRCYALQQNALGVLFVHPVKLRAVIENWKSLDPAEVAGHYDEPRCRRKASVVRRWELHLQLGTMNLFLAEILHNPVLECLIRYHDEMPGLRISTRGCMPRCIKNHFEMLTRHDIAGIE